MRLTKAVIQQILDQNDGFQKEVSFDDRNLRFTNHYHISGGQLYKRSKGKTSWADSHYDNKDICDVDQTRRFIKKYLNKLNIDGIE